MPTPVLIDTAYANLLGNQLPPVLFNGKYYIPLTNAQAGSGTLSMFQSPDGVTWTNIGDALTGIVQSAFTACFDGAHSILCLVETSTSGGEIVLIRFDTLSGTWGAPFANLAVGINSNPDTNYVVQRNDGSVVSASETLFWVWDGATWSSFPIFTNLPGPFVGGLQSVVSLQRDATGLVHSVSAIQNAGNTEQAYFYQQFTTVNTLGNFADLTSIAFPVVNFIPPNNVMVNNIHDWVVFGVLDTSQNARVFIGQGLSNPVWTLSAAIDPTVLSIDFSNPPYVSGYNDAKVWLVMPETDDQTFVLFGTTNVANPALGWALITTVVAPAVATIFNTNWGAASDPSGSVFFTEELAPSFNAQGYFALGGPIPPPPPPSGPKPIAGPMVGGFPIAGIFSLPDAATKCDIDGRKKCVIIKDLRPIQRSK